MRQNSELKSRIMTTEKEADEKMEKHNSEQILLRKEQRRLMIQKENLEDLIDGKVEAKTIEITKQLNETYEKRWKGKQHYLKGLLTYGVFVTVLEAVRSKMFVQDVVTFFKVFINVAWLLTKKDFELAMIAAKVSEHISNHTVAGITHWIIVGLICGASIFIMVLVGKIAGEKILDYYRGKPMDYITVTATMVNLAVMVFIGDKIKKIVPINLLLLLFVIQVVIEIIRSYVKGWKRARGLF